MVGIKLYNQTSPSVCEDTSWSAAVQSSGAHTTGSGGLPNPFPEQDHEREARGRKHLPGVVPEAKK